MDWNSFQHSIKSVIHGLESATNKEIEIKKQLNHTLTSYYKMKRTNHILQENNLKQLGIIPTYTSKSKSGDDNKNKELNIKVTSNPDDLSYFNSINEYLLLFRNNNDLMYRLANSLNQETQYVLSKVIVHFFYDDIRVNEASTALEKTIAFFVQKEIENTQPLFIESFLSEKTFLGKLLLEISNRNEMKVHIQHILKDIIKSIDKNNIEKGNSYLTLNLYELKEILNKECEKKNPSNFEIIDVPNITQNRSIINSSTNKDNRSPSGRKKQALKKCITSTSTYYAASILNESIYSNAKLNITSKYPNVRKYIGDELYQNIPTITEKSLKHLLSIETNEFMKSFYLKHLSILQSLKNKDCYSITPFRELIQRSPCYEKLVERYRENCEFILHLIMKLINNIKHNIPFIPKIIKHIARQIYSVLHNKYPEMSELELHSFVGRFYIETIIIPNLLNPHKNESLVKDKVLDVNVIKSILFLEPLLIAISRNTLFVDERDNNYLVFNPFILQNTLNVRNIFKDILEQNANNIFYNISKISEYVGEDIYQVMCLNKDEILIFADSYDKFPEDDRIQTARFHQVIGNKDNIFNKEKKNEENCITKTFYLFYNENFPESRKKSLCTIKKKEAICEAYSASQYVEEIKICMKYVLVNIPDFALNDGLACDYLFQSLNQIIEYYSHDYKNILISKLPLHWYSKFIVKKLDQVPDEYKENNYQKLLNEITDEIQNIGTILAEKNNVLQSQMTNELNSLKRLYRLSTYQYKQLKRQESIINLYHFINKTSIQLCLQNGFQIYELIYDVNNKNEESTRDFKLRYLQLETPKNCMHSKNNKFNHHNHHSHNIIEFIQNFVQYSHEIMQDIICSLPSDFTKKILPKEYQKFKEDNTKANEILEKFFLIIQQTNNNWIKNFFIKNFKLNHNIPKDDDDSSQEYSDDDEDKNDELINEEKLFEKVEQYIIYQICLKLHTDRNNYKSTPKHRLSSNNNSYNIIQKIDKKFEDKCKSLSWIDPVEHLKIKPAFLSDTQMKIASDYLDKSDNGISYDLIIKYLSKAINTLVNLFTFTTGTGGATIDDFVPVMCYLLIKLRPKRAISNFGLCKYFLNKKAMKQDIGFQLATLEMCLKYINSIDAVKIGLEYKKEYYIQKCKEALREK